MKKIVMLISIFILTLISSAFGAAEYHETSSSENNPMQTGLAEKKIQLDVNSTNYFEAGFATEPYEGGSPVFEADDKESNAIVLVSDFDDLIASNSVYVYWFYGTTQSLKLEIGCTALTSEIGESITLNLSYAGKSISSENPEARLNVFSKESSQNFVIDYGSTDSAIQMTSDSLLGKKSGTYTGYVTLYITN